jgi:hypothetical protein
VEQHRLHFVGGPFATFTHSSGIIFGMDSHADKAFILARQLADSVPGATIRAANLAGREVSKDPQFQEQLQALAGQQLSQFSIGLSGIRLSFWGKHISSVGREIDIEQERITITLPGGEPASVGSRSEQIATSLLGVLGKKLTAVDIEEGHLRLQFDDTLQMEVSPHKQFEAWQISSDTDLLIVCGPGGHLTVWYPERRD